MGNYQYPINKSPKNISPENANNCVKSKWRWWNFSANRLLVFGQYWSWDFTSIPRQLVTETKEKNRNKRHKPRNPTETDISIKKIDAIRCKCINIKDFSKQAKSLHEWSGYVLLSVLCIECANMVLCCWLFQTHFQKNAAGPSFSNGFMLLTELMLCLIYCR